MYNVYSPTHVIATGTAPRRGEPPLTDEQWSFIFRVLDNAHRSVIISSLTQGAADGVDTVAKSWAQLNHIETHDFPADWAAHNRAAGPIRNRHMVSTTIQRFGVDNITVVAFTTKPLEQSKGTHNCVYESQRKGLRVHHYRLDTFTKEF